MMLILIGVCIAVAALAILVRLRVERNVKAPPLGWMSQQWLAEHRAAHLP
jgi:hypothetical protein